MPREVKLIAEVASNHGGDLAVAKELIKVASEIGVDYVKFQSWQCSTLRDRENDPQYKWFKKAELSDKAHFELMAECNRRGVRFLTTCFDLERVHFLGRLGLKEVKVGSADAASYSMVERLKNEGFEHIIASTGMVSETELQNTARVLEGVNLTLLHCVSLYPCPPEKVNLNRMERLKQFTPSVGYSDHCTGVEAVKLAISRGARYVEKHFSLGEEAGCRRSPWDASPSEMEDIVRFAESCHLMLGTGELEPCLEEMEAKKRFIGRWGNNK